MKVKFLFFLPAVIFCFAFSSYPQNPCKPPEIVFNKNAYNIFDETQEMYLGEVMAEIFEKEYRVINDDEVTAYVRTIGEKLVKHLPPTSIKFQFFVVDVPDVNAFAMAGGRIYVTRKMIAFVRNEDELAGIIGHELGHGIVRHSAMDFSKLFKEIIGVEKVGDKRDVFEKYNQFIEKRRTKRVKLSRNHEDNQQLEADRIGLFAMTAAGYDPTAFTSAWDRLTETKGKTGSALSDFFGTTRPEEKRLREMLKAISTIPAECLDKRGAVSNENFEKWQSFVVTTSNFRRTEKLKALIAKKRLSPHLRGDVKYFQFSPDGNYILAQDDSGINVLKREPFSFVFRIETADAKFANFSPDSKFIVFSTYGLRVEKWSVEDKKPVLSREMYVRGACWQSALSPDGKYLVCYTGRWSLDIVNVETNERIFTKEKFYVPKGFEFYNWALRFSLTGAKEVDVFQMEFSPDSKYFLAGRTFRTGLFGTVLINGSLFMPFGNMNQDAYIGYDLQGNKEMKLNNEVKNVIAMPFAFYSNDKIIGQHRDNAEKSGIFTFPAGERVEKFYLNADSYTKPYQGDYIFVRPTTSSPVGVYDLQSKKFIIANKTAALDGFGDYFVSEGKDGIVDLLKFDKTTKKMQEVGSLTLPRNNFGNIKTVSLAPDFDWLVLSENSRGAVWNLKTGEMKIYIRGFRGSFVDADGSIYADFPYFEKEPRFMGMLNPVTNVAGSLGPIEKRNVRQFGKFLVQMRTKLDEQIEKRMQQRAEKSDKSSDKDNKENPEIRLDAASMVTLFSSFTPEEGTLEVWDSRTQKLIWSKFFPNEIPKYQFYPASETAALYWKVTTKAAQNEIKNDPALSQKLKSLGNKEGDYLVQILDANTGNLSGAALIETGEGSFTIEKVFANGDWLTVIDSENRVLIYSLSKGELRWRFFGGNAVINSAKSIAVIENSEGQLSIYNLNSGQKTDELQFPSAVAYAAFSNDGKKLFILTADQNYYLFNVDGFTVQ
jgi:WD40 repeat protein